VLALDFDGVVCDALLECAAVTWHAVKTPEPEAPDLATAVAVIPPEFMETFASVRPLSRTLEDFMVAHAVDPGELVDGTAFAAHRDRLGAGWLTQRSMAGERLRARWREHEPELWLDQHSVFAEVATFLQRGAHDVAIVSAKDAESVWAILHRHDLAAHVRTVIGSCGDKRPALSALRDDHGPLVFVDDNLGHVTAAGALTGVEARWATWGYHTPADVEAAPALGVRPLALHQLDQLDIAVLAG
jgi:phosphoglycolate phosphatase-like HAD superfamily hydrolase